MREYVDAKIWSLHTVGRAERAKVSEVTATNASSQWHQSGWTSPMYLGLWSPAMPSPGSWQAVLENNTFSYCSCLVIKSCPTLCDPMDCSSPGSSVLGIRQARILEWIIISFSRGSSQPKNRNCVSSISCITADSLLLSHWESPTSSLPPSKSHESLSHW